MEDFIASFNFSVDTKKTKSHKTYLDRFIQLQTVVEVIDPNLIHSDITTNQNQITPWHKI
jgi:hypothetical protein